MVVDGDVAGGMDCRAVQVGGCLVGGGVWTWAWQAGGVGGQGVGGTVTDMGVEWGVEWDPITQCWRVQQQQHVCAIFFDNGGRK